MQGFESRTLTCAQLELTVPLTWLYDLCWLWYKKMKNDVRKWEASDAIRENMYTDDILAVDRDLKAAMLY